MQPNILPANRNPKKNKSTKSTYGTTYKKVGPEINDGAATGEVVGEMDLEVGEIGDISPCSKTLSLMLDDVSAPVPMLSPELV